jgi:uncharacterized protein
MSPHTRRDALKLLGASAAAVPLARAKSYVAEEVRGGEVESFGLANVRLAPGPFLDAQKLDAEYLLRLEPDRMLANFRKNAGLEPKAPVYGGWESVEPWIWIRCHGHTLGHYLTAASCMYESTGDVRFAARVDTIVAELAECQAKTGGWLTAFPDGVAPLVDSLAGKEFAGVPWYTVHKVMAGLRDAHRHRGSRQARDVLVKFGDWIHRASADVPDDRFQKMLDREHGGMNEVFVDLFELTNDPRFRELAVRFSHRALLDPLAQGVDKLDGLHANTQIPKVVGFSRMRRMTGDRAYWDAASFFWQTVTRNRSYVTGGHGDVEHFFPGSEFAKRLDSAKTMETCCTHNMLRLTRSLHAQSNAPDLLDYFERGLFNGILASQDPESGMMTYFQSTRPGYVRLYHTPFDSFWCCTGSGMENHARYGENIFANQADALYVNQFIASTLEWRARGLTLSLETRFPDSDTSRVIIRAGKPQKFVLAIRKPGWCNDMTMRVNEGRWKPVDSAGYAYVERRFRPGDVVEFRTPMRLSLEALPNAPDHGALLYGPIVLAGRLGTAGLTPGSQLIVNERESGNMLKADVVIPRWSKPLDQLVAHTVRTHPERLEFRASGFDGGASVELIPWFRLAHERYNLYWHV